MIVVLFLFGAGCWLKHDRTGLWGAPRPAYINAAAMPHEPAISASTVDKAVEYADLTRESEGAWHGISHPTTDTDTLAAAATGGVGGGGAATIELMFGGDMLLADANIEGSLKKECHEPFRPSAGKYDTSHVCLTACEWLAKDGRADKAWGNILGRLRAADAVFANLETTVSDKPFVGHVHPNGWSKRLRSKLNGFQAITKALDIVNAVPLAAVSLANNHVYDSKNGPMDTVAALDSAGVPHAGAGATLNDAMRHVTLVRQGKRIAFLSLSDLRSIATIPSNDETASFVKEMTAGAGAGHPGIWDIHTPEGESASKHFSEAIFRPVKAKLQALKEDHDIVVAFFHWQPNFAGFIAKHEYLTMSHRFIDAGADAFVGGHPHHAQGISVYKGRPVILGNGEILRSYFDWGFKGTGAKMKYESQIVYRMVFSTDAKAVAFEMILVHLDGTQCTVNTHPAGTSMDKERLFVRGINPDRRLVDSELGLRLDEPLPGLILASEQADAVAAKLAYLDKAQISLERLRESENRQLVLHQQPQPQPPLEPGPSNPEAARQLPPRPPARFFSDGTPYVAPRGEVATMPPVRETGDRIIHFIEGADFEWGNQVRGMVFATLYAVLTDRRLVMDPNSKYVKHFRFPARGAPLRLASNAGDRKRLDPGECVQDPAKCLEFKQRVIEHASGTTMDQRYTRTPAIRDKLKRLFGTDNHALISYCVVRWLFQSPRPLFLEAAAAYRDGLGLKGKKFVVFQLRSWADVPSKFKQLTLEPGRLLATEFDKWHDGLGDGAVAHDAYLTSDSRTGVDALASVLQGNARIRSLKRAHDFVHTTGKDNVKEHVSSAMIDWFLLGDAGVEATFCSGTTFCISGVSRASDPPVRFFSHGRRPENAQHNWRDAASEFDWAGHAGSNSVAEGNETIVWR